MKILLNSAAVAAVLFGVAGASSAQIEVRTAPIHAVPADEEAAELGPDLSADRHAASRPSRDADELLASLATPAPEASALSAEETAFFTALGRRVTDAASAYEAYVREAAAIDARFTGPAQVQAALRVGEGYNPAQLQEGMIAYVAVLALRSQAFVDGVRAQADLSLPERLAANPDLVLRIRGSDEAAQDVAGVLRVQAAGVAAAGQSISQAAYTIQHEAWSRGAVGEPARVLASAKASALALASADARAERRLLNSIGTAASSAPEGNGPSPAVVRGLALAAVAILGRAGDANEAAFAPLLRDARGTDCLQMAKLNLNQCLAVAGPHYEDVFCLGRHAVSETAQCLSVAAGSAAAARPSALQSAWSSR